MKNDFEIIKKLYGERMAKLCRELFPTLLETEGLLAERMQLVFAPSKNLYDDLVSQDVVDDFRAYILSLDKRRAEKHQNIEKTPAELMALAGYDLYECKTNEDILKFKKYYTFKEELCTFRDPRRIENFQVFFAVKKGAEKLNRNDFVHPRRQDEYGTSVISLQFTKGENKMLSIKNRYNHSVKNPDATFSNNLDNIIPGLTDSFYKYYGISLSNTVNSLNLENYVETHTGQFYRFNQEIENIYFCENNIMIKDGKVYKFDKNRYELIDYFVVDKKNRTIKTRYLLGPVRHDAFLDDLQDLEKIEITKAPTKNNRFFRFYTKKGVVTVEVNLANQIVGYTNDNIQKIGDNFLEYNTAIEYFNAKNIQKIGNNFLELNNSLKTLNLPVAVSIGDEGLSNAESLQNIVLPEATQLGEYCFWNAKNVKRVFAPKLTKIDLQCFNFSNNIDTFYAPNVKKVSPDVLRAVSTNNPYAQIIMPKFAKSIKRMQEQKKLALSYAKQTECEILENEPLSLEQRF